MDIKSTMEKARADVEWHEVAAVFPLMSEDALKGLSDDIKREGLLEPVMTMLEGDEELVVDGRNRQMACIDAGVPVVYSQMSCPDDFGKDELASRIWSLNFTRRHLTPSQLGMAAAEMRKYLSGTIPEAAAVTGSSQRNAERAERLIREGSGALIESVNSGVVTLFEADKVLKLDKAEQTRRVLLLREGKIKSITRVSAPKPEPETDGEQAWLDAVQEPYDKALSMLQSVLGIIELLDSDTELNKYLPANRLLVDITSARNSLYQNYPLLYHGGPTATKETHPESCGVGFLTRFVWDGLSENDRQNINSTEIETDEKSEDTI